MIRYQHIQSSEGSWKTPSDWEFLLKARSQGSSTDASNSNWYESRKDSLVNAPQRPYGPDSRAFWDLQTQGKSGERGGLLSLLHSLWRYIAQLDAASFLHCVSSFPDSCLPCFLFLFPLFSKMFISRTASVLSSLGISLPQYLLSPLSLFLRVSLETGLVAWLPSAALFFFFLWGWDQMASNRSSWSPWLPGWQSTWERHILQPGAVRPFLRGRKKIKPLPSYLHIYIFLKCSRAQALFMFYIAT